MHAVAIGGSGRATGEVVAFIGGQDEQRVGLVDAIFGQPGEELAPCLIIGLQARNVASLAGVQRRRIVDGIVMHVGDVGEGDGDAVLLHGGNIGKRL